MMLARAPPSRFSPLTRSIRCVRERLARAARGRRIGARRPRRAPRRSPTARCLIASPSSADPNFSPHRRARATPRRQRHDRRRDQPRDVARRRPRCFPSSSAGIGSYSGTLYRGGPVAPTRLLFLVRGLAAATVQGPEIVDKVFLSGDPESLPDITRLAERPRTSSGCTPGTRNGRRGSSSPRSSAAAGDVVPATADLVFSGRAAASSGSSSSSARRRGRRRRARPLTAHDPVPYAYYAKLKAREKAIYRRSDESRSSSYRSATRSCRSSNAREPRSRPSIAPRSSARRRRSANAVLERPSTCRVSAYKVLSTRPSTSASELHGLYETGDRRTPAVDPGLDADRVPQARGRVSDVPADAAPRALPPPRLRAAGARGLLPHRGLLQTRIEPVQTARRCELSRAADVVRSFPRPCATGSAHTSPRDGLPACLGRVPRRRCKRGSARSATAVQLREVGEVGVEVDRRDVAALRNRDGLVDARPAVPSSMSGISSLTT